jgi:tmRNA-binding protein
MRVKSEAVNIINNLSKSWSEQTELVVSHYFKKHNLLLNVKKYKKIQNHVNRHHMILWPVRLMFWV